MRINIPQMSFDWSTKSSKSSYVTDHSILPSCKFSLFSLFLEVLNPFPRRPITSIYKFFFHEWRFSQILFTPRVACKVTRPFFRISYCLFNTLLKVRNKNTSYETLWHIETVLYYSTNPVKYEYRCIINIPRNLVPIIRGTNYLLP